MTGMLAVAHNAVARSAQQATILAQISGQCAWVIRQVLAVDPQPSACPDCNETVMRTRVSDGRRQRVNPPAEAGGLYLAHRLSCPVASPRPKRERR